MQRYNKIFSKIYNKITVIHHKNAFFILHVHDCKSTKLSTTVCFK